MLSAELTTGELARLLGRSRWTARRRLLELGIPFEQERRGGRIRILFADLRAKHPRLAASLQEVAAARLAMEPTTVAA